MTIANSNCIIYTLDGIELREIFRYNDFLNETAKIQLGDFNGDGKMDFLYRNSETDNNTPWRIRYGTGREFTPETTFSFQSTPNIIGGYSDDHLALADFNGDGKTDIYHAVRNASRFDIYYSKANNDFETQNINGISVGYTQTPPGDINGDGVADVIDRDYYGDPAKIFYFNKNRRDHLLQKVKNGIGHVTEWEYERLNKDGDILDPFYRRSNPNRTFPINSIKVPMRAVSAFKVTNGVGGMATKTFKYKDAILHIGGKGFMGFEKIITSDISADVIVEAENEVNNSKYLLLPKRTDTYKLSNLDHLSESNSSIQVVDAGGLRYRVQVNSSTQVNHFEKKSSVTTNGYNGYGLVTSSNTKLYGGNQQVLIEESNSSTQYGQHGGRIPNKPTNVTASKSRGGYNSSETKTMEYDGYGQLTAKTDFAGQPQSVRTEYSYDILGNITQTRLQPSNMAQRTVSSSYDGKGRFVTSSTNVINQTSSSSYNSFGQVTSTTGIDGLTTSFQYDGFGRLTQTTLPTNVQINQSKGWDFGYGAIYYNSIQHPGKPDQKTFYDILGREVRTETDGFGGKTVITDKSYTDRGQIASSSQEHYRSDQGADPYLITNNSYDTYNRLTSSSNQSSGTTYVSYSYNWDGKMTINTTDPGGRNSSKVMDAAGKTIQSTDNGGTQNYVYNAQDKLMSVTNTDGTVLNSSVYDQYGRQTQLNDLSAGTTNYSYDALGQLTSETNAKNQTHNMYYDIMGRITLRTGPEGNTSTEYFGTEGAKTNQLKKITGFSNETTEYDYNDGYGRLTNVKLRIDNTDYNSSMNYNIYGDLIQKNFPSGLVIKYNYEGNGYLQFIRKGDDNVIFQNTDQNALGQVKSYNLGNGRGSSNSYNYGIPTQYYTGGVQHLALDWNYQTGNLNSRVDYAKRKSESFTYDDLDRLTSTTVAGQATINMGFAPSGNITSKTDVGNYVYDGTKKHAVKEVNGATSAIPSFTQDIDFTSYERPEKIRENGFELNYTYGADYERIKGVMTQNGNNVYTRYFLGDFERNIQNGTTKDIHYISSPAGLVAIVVRENGNDSYNYTYTDHLGSILTIEKSDGNFVHQNFDAWGRRRDATTWVPMALNAVTGLPDWLYRGYTGHEHLDQFGIINMNARLYDPVLGRMISPDNFVNGAFGTQGYNRYSYANNNPLKYIDPSGNIPFLVGAGILLIKAALISSISTLAIQATTSIIAGSFTLSPDAIAKSGLQGAVGAALGFGIGEIFRGLSGFGIDLAKAAAHAASGGVQSAIFGGNFGDGAISGLVGSLTGSAGTSLGISNSLVGSYLIGGTASAITSQITGGDPFQAFITGGTVAAFNHYLHKLDSPVDRRGGYVVGFTPKGEMIVRSMTKEGNVFEYTTRAQKRTQLSVKKSLRTPDYTQVSLGIPIGLSPLSFSPSYTVDRYGQNYLSPGVGLGFGTGVSVSVTANWLEQTSTPYPDEMYNFLSGASVSGTAGFGFGVQGTQSSTGQNASGFGFMTPQFGGSYSYTPSWLIWNKQ